MVLLIISSCVTAITGFSYWAINAEALGRYHLGGAIGYALLSAMGFYASFIVAAICIVALLFGIFRSYPISVVAFALAISAVPLGYVFYLDYG